MLLYRQLSRYGAVKMSFSARLQQVLHEFDWNQSELARRLGVKPQSVQSWLKGVTPRMDKLEKLAEVTGKPMHWFFTEQQEDVQKEELQCPTSREKEKITEKQRLILELFDDLPESDTDIIIKELEVKRNFYARKLKELLLKKKHIS